MLAFILRAVALTALFFCLDARANPMISLELSENSSGNRILVDILASIVNLPDQAIGGYDIVLQFDPAYLDLESVDYSWALGFPADRIDQVTQSTPGTDPATVRMFSVSLLETSLDTCVICTGPYLVDFQAANFRLATLEFDWTGPGNGTTTLSALSVELSDGMGNYMPINPVQPLQITHVPEPDSLGLVALGLLALLYCGMRKPGRIFHLRYATLALAGVMLAGSGAAQAQDRERHSYIAVITPEPPLLVWNFDYPDRALMPLAGTEELHIGETVIANFDGDRQIRWDFLLATRDNPSALYLYSRSEASAGLLFVGMLEDDPKAAYWLARGRPELAPDYGLGLIAGDLDNDGDPDFLEAVNKQFGEGLFWIARGNAWMNDGRGNFERVANAFDFSSIFTGHTLGMSSTLADLNGDGFVDMLASEQRFGGNTTSRVYALFGNGDGTFGAPVYVFTAPHPATFISIGDVNNNGTADALVGMDDDGDPGQVYVFFGNGDGTFVQHSYEAFDTNPVIEDDNDSGGAGKFQLADVTEDGILDVVLSAAPQPGDPPSGRLWLYEGLGDGRFEPRLDLGTTFVNTAFSAQYLEPVEVRMPGDLFPDAHIDDRDVARLAGLLQRQEPSRDAMGPHDPFDINRDGIVNIADVRKLVLMCTLPRCARPPEPPGRPAVR